MQVHMHQGTVVVVKEVSSFLLICECQELNLGLSVLEASDFTHWAILLVPVAQANLELTASTITIPSFT